MRRRRGNKPRQNTSALGKTAVFLQHVPLAGNTQGSFNAYIGIQTSQVMNNCGVFFVARHDSPPKN